MPDRPCRSDLRDAGWAALEPLLPPPCRRGRPPEVAAPGDGRGHLPVGPLRLRMADAATPLSAIAKRSLGVMSAPRTGPTVHAQRTRWRKGGMSRRRHDRLRGNAREKDGRDREPGAAVIDAPPARATGAAGPGPGFDAAKKTFKRKRHSLVEASGPILLAYIHAANLHDTVGARPMIEAAPMAAWPRLALAWADGAHTGPFATWPGNARNGRLGVPFPPSRPGRRAAA
jgi:transposase